MIFYALTGIFFGVIGGMGMGGGIILIPVLTLLLGKSQHTAQALNLAAFLPMSIFALLTHFRQKRIAVRESLKMALFGLLGAVPGALLANIADGTFLKKCFGAFLIILGILRIIKKLRAHPKN